MKRSALAALGFLAISLSAEPAAAGCVISKLVEFPVTMAGHQAMVAVMINGADKRLIVDSGAFYSMISPANAAELKLPVTATRMMAGGMGGLFDLSQTTVKRLTLVGQTIPDVVFFVGGSEVGRDTAGLLGQNVLGIADVEYDLANGVVRLTRPGGCNKDQPLVYWAKAGAYGVMDLGSYDQVIPRIRPTTGVAFVNGVKVRVLFDTGAPLSILTLGAAKRAGVDLKGAGVIAAGPVGGLGRRSAQSWIAPVASFKIGDEEVHNTRLRFADLTLLDYDMALGADFFLSHHVYVAKSQGKIYFTYNGGPVFNLEATPQGQAPDAGPKPTDAAPLDAEGYARRGAAFAARREFGPAIADLTRARELAPSEPRYPYQRAMAYLANNQPSLAMADLEQALKLAPDDVAALMTRAELRLSNRDKPRALIDLDAADRLAAKQANSRLELADLYEIVDALPSALAQFDLWIKAHPEDSNERQAQARNGRCWVRALMGQDLDKALADCNAALRISPKNPALLDSRGLVLLRVGELDKAIADYDLALSERPKSAWSLYGRGLAKLKKGLAAEAKADIAAAIAIDPHLPDEANAHGIAP